MKRNLAPLGGRFNSNRNGRIAELSCLYCHLFYLLLILFNVILQGKGNYIFTLVPSINPVSDNSYLFGFFAQLSGEQMIHHQH